MTDNLPDLSDIDSFVRSATDSWESPRDKCIAIHVGGFRDPTMNWVRLSLKGGAPGGADPPAGYSDGEDVGPGCEPRNVAYRWGENLALGRPYVTSRAAAAESGNPDTGGAELTNGIVIAPTEYATARIVQPATALWDPGDPVAVTVDLGDVASIAGVRVATHQPGERYCHPDRVEVAVSPDGDSWQPAGEMRHVDIWNPPGDYEPWEHDDDPDYARFPAGGRLAYSFSLVFERSKRARFVRFTAFPLEGRGLGLSEVQVFDRVTATPWPGDIFWEPVREGE